MCGCPARQSVAKQSECQTPAVVGCSKSGDCAGRCLFGLRRVQVTELPGVEIGFAFAAPWPPRESAGEIEIALAGKVFAAAADRAGGDEGAIGGSVFAHCRFQSPCDLAD